MDTIQKIRKENTNYLAHNKICNATDLQLYYFKDFIEEQEGRSEQEQYLLECLEREVNQLKYTIECYKNELDKNHYKATEELSKED